MDSAANSAANSEASAKAPPPALVVVTPDGFVPPVVDLAAANAAASATAAESPAVAPAAAKALTKAPPAPIGLTAAGTPVYAPFQPSVASLAVQLTPFLRTAVGLNGALPLPTGLELVRAPDDSQTQLKLTPFFALKNRMMFGYVAEIKLSSGDGTDTPAQLQVVCRIPWRYGVTSAGAALKFLTIFGNSRNFSPFERDFSWIYVRVQAFASKALFASAATIVKLGSCVSGFAEPTSGSSKSCQLVGWDVIQPADWKILSPSTFPVQMDINMDAIFVLPQLSGVNFFYTRLPQVSHCVLSAGPIGGTYALPAELTGTLVTQLRQQHLAQSLMYGSAPSAVAHVPPPPGRGRAARADSSNRVRSQPPPVQPFTGGLLFGYLDVCFEYLLSCLSHFLSRPNHSIIRMEEQLRRG